MINADSEAQSRAQRGHKGVSGRLVVSVLSGAIAIAFSTPLLAASDIELLREELAQQRKMLAQQQKTIEALEQRLETQAVAAAAPGKQAAATAATQQGADKPLLTVYGILDGGVEHITNIGTSGKSLTRVPGITGTLPSRLGFRVNKEFKPGYSGIGTLEIGFNLDDGTQGQSGSSSTSDRVFGRQAFVGLQTPAGTFTFGRQYSMLLPAMAASDFMGPNIYALGSFDAYLPNARYDNSLAWRGKFDKLSLGVAYSFGRDTSGGAPASGTCAGEQANIADTQECKAWSMMARYDAANFGVALGIDQIKGGTGATSFFFNGAPPFAFSSSGDKDRRVSLGGNVKLGAVKLGLGWLRREVSTDALDVESNTYYLSASYPINDLLSIDGAIYRIGNDEQDRDATLAVVRGFYKLDKGLDAYAQIGRIHNSSNASYALSGAGGGTAPKAGASQSGYMVGLRYIF